MSLLKGLAARVASVIRPEAAESRMEEEFRFHVEMETQRLIGNGVTQGEARRRAFVAFGGLDTHREAMRDGRGARLLSELTSDVRYALRSLRKTPAFTLSAVLTLGLGLGGTVTVFTLVNAVYFGTLPFPEPDQLVWIHTLGRPCPNGSCGWVSLTERERQDWLTSLETIADIGAGMELLLTGEVPSGEQRMPALRVTSNFLSLLGVQPILGRGFLPGADAPDAEGATVLSHDLWRREFGSDSTIVGRHLVIQHRAPRVVGGLPATAALGQPFVFGERGRLTAAYLIPRGPRDDILYRFALARLKPGASLDELRSRIDVLTAPIGASSVGAQRGYERSLWTVRVASLREMYVRPLSR